jgi:hypothetical protein
MAEGNELVAEGTCNHDPIKAAEYHQIAYNFRRQLGESGEYNKRMIREYTKTCTCWICGRRATGAGIHFCAMSADIGPEYAFTEDDELAPSVETDLSMIFVCKACYTSISRRADYIAKEYYELSVAEIEDVYDKLMKEIERLDTRITNLYAERREEYESYYRPQM